jgi:hypothetical protein
MINYVILNGQTMVMKHLDEIHKLLLPSQAIGNNLHLKNVGYKQNLTTLNGAWKGSRNNNCQQCIKNRIQQNKKSQIQSPSIHSM